MREISGKMALYLLNRGVKVYILNSDGSDWRANSQGELLNHIKNGGILGAK